MPTSSSPTTPSRGLKPRRSAGWRRRRAKGRSITSGSGGAPPAAPRLDKVIGSRASTYTAAPAGAWSGSSTTGGCKEKSDGLGPTFIRSEGARHAPGILRWPTSGAGAAARPVPAFRREASAHRGAGRRKRSRVRDASRSHPPRWEVTRACHGRGGGRQIQRPHAREVGSTSPCSPHRAPPLTTSLRRTPLEGGVGEFKGPSGGDGLRAEVRTPTVPREIPQWRACACRGIHWGTPPRASSRWVHAGRRSQARGLKAGASRPQGQPPDGAHLPQAALETASSTPTRTRGTCS